MTEAQTIPAKYIFLDVVSFTHNRSVEAQTDIVHVLNTIVAESIADFEIERESVIYLPTGDGICITLLNIVNPFDIHILIALSILKRLSEHNEKAEENEQKFEVRIGINANDDNLVTDINGKQNIAGEGINMAARVMSKADGNQILVGEMVYETLRSRKKYMKDFRGFNTLVKHGRQMKVYQYILKDCLGLNTETPSSFQTKQSEEIKLSRQSAYYFANAIKYEKFTFAHNDGGQSSYSIIVILWFLAKDSLGHNKSSKISQYEPIIYGEGKLDLEEVYKYYDSINFRIICELASFVGEELSECSQYFERDIYGSLALGFLKDAGKEKLKKEFSDIWQEFELDSI